MNDDKSEFLLKEWEVWFTYTTALSPSNINIKNLADCLVESEIAHLSMLKDGYTTWRTKNGIGKGQSNINFDSDFNNKGRIKFEKAQEETIDLEEFAAEAWYQSCYFRYNELRLFGEYSTLPPNYVRAFLGKCILYKNSTKKRIHLYPVLTVYETGVLSIEFRCISPSIPFSLNEFISDVVNIPQLSFDKVDVPPALSKISSKAYMRNLSDWNMRERSKLLKWEKEHNKGIDANTYLDENGDFSFELSPLSSEENQKEWLYTLALTIFDSVAYLLSKSREGKKFILFGDKISHQFDGYWIGRPHIYLCDFTNRQKTAKMNEKAFRSEFGKILMQSNKFPSELNQSSVPQDVRMFDDYSAFLGQTLSLWVWSDKGIENQELWEDPNRGHLIYEPQSKMRILDYVYVLHRRLLNETLTLKNYDQVISVRRELIEFEQKISEITKYGEIRELLDFGWSQLGLDDVKKRIDKALALQQEEKSNKETRSYRKIGITLTILFGLASLPTIATDILGKIWKWFNWVRPKDELSFQLLLLIITFGLISTVGVFFFNFTNKKKT